MVRRKLVIYHLKNLEIFTVFHIKHVFRKLQVLLVYTVLVVEGLATSSEKRQAEGKHTKRSGKGVVPAHIVKTWPLKNS